MVNPFFFFIALSVCHQRNYFCWRIRVRQISNLASSSLRPSNNNGHLIRNTVRVHVKVVEGSRERIQVFEGVVIKRRGGGISETFVVRKISYGVGVERTFPVHSPKIDKLEVMRRGKVRRAKLYYLRNLRGKAARIKEIR